MNFYYPIEVRPEENRKPIARMDNPTYKGLLWKSIQRERSIYESRFNVVFRQVLSKQFKQLADEIRSDNMRDVSLVNKIEQEPIEKAMIALYQEVGRNFAKEQYSKSGTERILTKDIEEDEWLEWLRNYVKTKAGEKIVSMTAETRRIALEIIRQVLELSTDEGWGADKTAAEIKKALVMKGGEIAKWRALRIARTEVMTASNIGAMLGAQSTGLPMEKYWIATYDSRTRDTHLDVEQQNPKAMDEGFRVGAYMMEMPGDPDAGPEEVINCRCAVAFEVKNT